MWTYEQRTGRLLRPDGTLAGIGYSGFGASRNKPEDEALPGLGPIPRGLYRFGPEEDSPTKGPVMLRMTPISHDAHGRSNFELHGDSKQHPGAASHGCIIQTRDVREEVAGSEDDLCNVVEGAA